MIAFEGLRPSMLHEGFVVFSEGMSSSVIQNIIHRSNSLRRLLGHAFLCGGRNYKRR